MKTLLTTVIGKTEGLIRSGGERMLPDFAIVFISVMRKYKRQFGVFPNLLHPKTINEKILYRMLFDRRPILTQLEDKFAVRDYVRQKIGEHVLPKWHCVTTNPSTIPFDELPEKFVVKPTHGSGWVRIVHDKTQLNRAELVDTCRYWMSQNYYDLTREWVYKHIEPRIVVEELISDGTGPVPRDYRLFVFNGRVELIRVDVRGSELRWNHYDRSWDKLTVPCRFQNIEGDVARPRYLDDMMRYAEILGESLGFVRIDMYHTQDEVYFGEATTIPMGGMMVAYPHEFNLYLGNLWKLSLR